MALLLNLLLIAAVVVVVIMNVTAQSRARAAFLKRSRPLGDRGLAAIAERYHEALEVAPFEVRVLKDLDEVNAIVFPTGEIFLARGLYTKYLDGEITRDEVAGVIAHEIGHVALGHLKKRLQLWRWQTVGLVAAVGLFGRALFGWPGLLALLVLRLFTARMTQRDEFEADAFGAQLMMRAGVDPGASVSLLEKLDLWTNGLSGKLGPFRWLISHPPIGERIEGLRQVIAAGPPPSVREAARAPAPENWASPSPRG